MLMDLLNDFRQAKDRLDSVQHETNELLLKIGVQRDLVLADQPGFTIVELAETQERLATLEREAAALIIQADVKRKLVLAQQKDQLKREQIRKFDLERQGAQARRPANFESLRAEARRSQCRYESTLSRIADLERSIAQIEHATL